MNYVVIYLMDIERAKQKGKENENESENEKANKLKFLER